MAAKDIKKLNRSDLMEILLEVSKENEELKVKVEELEAKVEEREINIAEAGSIAEASLKLNGVFKAADKAAKQYLESIAKLHSEQDSIAEKIQLEAKRKAAAIIERANEYDRDVRAQADEYWKSVTEKVEKLLQDSDDLMMLLQAKRKKNNEEEK